MGLVPFRIKFSLWLLAGIAAILIVVPLLIPVPPLENVVESDQPRRELAGDASRFFRAPADAGAIELHFRRWGPDPSDASAPPLLLIHGFGSSLDTWREVAPELAGARPVVAYDRPAAGLTERKLEWDRVNPYTPAAQVQQVLALLDAQGAERAVLVGNSAGGSLALRVALEHPERVAGLVLVAPAVYRGGGAPAWSRPLLYTPQLERIGPLLMRQLGGEPGRNLLRSAWADAARVPDAAYDAFERSTRVPDWDRALWELTQASRDAVAAGRVSRVEPPVLVIAGDADAIVPIEQSRRLATEIPDATLRVLEGCGHVPQEECPQAFVDAVAGWLEARR